MFNLHATLNVIPLDEQSRFLIVDDALADPDMWVQNAAKHQDKFAALPGNAYPGGELRMPEEVSQALMNFIRVPIRQYLNARRLIDGYSRLSMVTQKPEQLLPRQWICHRDRLSISSNQMAIASVLYLFKNEALGGTHFFKPKQASLATKMLIHASSMMDAEDFQQKYAISPGYMTQSNAYFERVCTVAAKWNRLIIYDGMQFHSGDIQHPELLTDNPQTGRLTLNGFFTARHGL
ncbi:MAG: hypothetical protein KA902_00785 [Arenimonas sp.]|nr:hypothetical protein [Arenimonas sp.]